MRGLKYKNKNIYNNIRAAAHFCRGFLVETKEMASSGFPPRPWLELVLALVGALSYRPKRE
jgi:hypothetical protein